MMVKLVLTGGGTAGHVMPHIAMLQKYRDASWDVVYVGGKGIEGELAREAGIPFFEIQTGKLRRYFSWDNFLDILRLLAGIVQSTLLLMKIKPDLVFSKGGFVSVPVATAAWILKIPVVSHESDITPGLANRMIKPLCKAIFYAFPETSKYLKGASAFEVGIPVRTSLLQGSKTRGLDLCGFEDTSEPVLLVMGGSSGAERINSSLEPILSDLVKHYRIIHICGRGKKGLFSHPKYRSFEFVGHEMGDLLAASDAVVSRAGANSLFELRALAKPMLLIPLEIASRGDQIDNSRSFVSKGWAMELRETGLSPEKLFAGIGELMDKQGVLQQAMVSSGSYEQGASKIMECLNDILKMKR